MNLITIGRQPMTDHNGNIQAYEWFFRQSEQKNTAVATSHLIMTLINQAGMEATMEADTIFLNIDIRFLATGLVQTLPKQKFVFDIPYSVALRHQDLEMISYLHKEGYRFALDNITIEDGWQEKIRSVLSMIEFLKIDMSNVTTSECIQLSPYKHSHKLIAHKLENDKQLQLAKQFGFELCQGYYISEPELKTYESLPILKRSIYELYKLIQADVSINQLADFFRDHIDIALTLLQFFSNLKIEYEKEITSFCDVLNAIGRKQLRDWSLMLVYSKIGMDDSEEVDSYYQRLKEKRARFAVELEDGPCDEKDFLALMKVYMEVI
ncbi:EAL domain-containing protein [Sulfurimonas marina]|uniref:EAL domain-containing protein n=1 Tax=Sulfurimonas marina TaxID=2590551 RepID=A0A7M1AX23_9BACT|nr:EAL domain-containing protein [Sulfurimonas marina]QOP41876.1 EAL domain-containing protein [Sulfurimonas marina]